jgi:sugar phosphate isomerase/epimerase
MTDKFGICEWCFAVNGPTAVKYAGMIGFDGIQLGDLGGSGNSFPLNDPLIQKDYLETAERYNIELHSIHLFSLVREGGLQCPPNSSEGRRALHSIQKGLEAARGMNVPKLLVTSYDACSIINDYDLECTAEMLKEACRMAADYGIQMVYESILRGDKIKEILDDVGTDLKLCYDILNPIKFLRGEPVEEIKLFNTKWIDHVHLKDTPRNMKGFCELGTGRGRFKDSIRALDEVGFDGWYITENFYHLPPLGAAGSIFETAKADLNIMQQMKSKK